MYDRVTSITPPARMNGHPRRILLISEMARHAEPSLHRLRDAGFELIDGYQLTEDPSEKMLANALAGIWATVAGSERYTRQVLEHAIQLKAIARCGVGYDAIDVGAATELGVSVLITPDGNFDTVADYALTLMLACLRRLITLDQTVRSGGWRDGSLSGDLFGATVGIVGLGRIGRAVARRLTGFDCRVLGVEEYPDLDTCKKLGVELTSLEKMLPEVDVLTLHVPRTPMTIGMIGASEIARMKSSAIIVNTARGGILDEQALYEAIASQRLAGAGLDVFDVEPIPRDHPLFQCENVIITGHVSSFTRLAARRTMDAVVNGLLDLADGKSPYGHVNPWATSFE